MNDWDMDRIIGEMSDPNCPEDGDTGMNFKRDRNYYHKKYSYHEIKHSTEKSNLITFPIGDLWIPKSLCQDWDLENKTVYVHQLTFMKIRKKFLDGQLEKRKDAFFNPVRVHAEIEYVREEDRINIHSDICPPNCDPNELSDEDYRTLLHECLDEWLDKSRGTGGFYIKNEAHHFEFAEAKDYENN